MPKSHHLNTRSSNGHVYTYTHTRAHTCVCVCGLSLSPASSFSLSVSVSRDRQGAPKPGFGSKPTKMDLLNFQQLRLYFEEEAATSTTSVMDKDPSALVCVCLFVLCNRHWFNRSRARNRFSGPWRQPPRCGNVLQQRCHYLRGTRQVRGDAVNARQISRYQDPHTRWRQPPPRGGLIPKSGWFVPESGKPSTDNRDGH